MTENPNITVKLGGREFVVRPLTFKQLREFQPAILKSRGLLREPADFDYALGAILVCVQRDNPEFTREVAEDMTITAQDLIETLDALALWTGLLKKADPAAEGEKAAQAGEAQAAAM